MKLLTLCLSLLLFVALAACKASEPVDWGPVIRETVAATDKNRDGQVSKAEIRDAKSDPSFWIAVGSGLMAMLAGAGATAASKKANKVEVETDEQWDSIKQLEVKQK